MSSLSWSCDRAFAWAEFESMLETLGVGAEVSLDAARYMQLEAEGGEVQSSSGVWGWLKSTIRMRSGVDDQGEEVDPELDDEWLGRALDTERRVMRLVDASERRLMAQVMANHEEVMARLTGGSAPRGAGGGR
jgi:hypothetical protein